MPAQRCSMQCRSMPRRRIVRLILSKYELRLLVARAPLRLKGQLSWTRLMHESSSFWQLIGWACPSMHVLPIRRLGGTRNLQCLIRCDVSDGLRLWMQRVRRSDVERTGLSTVFDSKRHYGSRFRTHCVCLPDMEDSVRLLRTVLDGFQHMRSARVDANRGFQCGSRMTLYDFARSYGQSKSEDVYVRNGAMSSLVSAIKNTKNKRTA